ncbi:flagellar export protein FliJ [Bacteriovorax sp. Seq25_V]|uniref:flagellar export protein FliJ n=1 Tax=Bacteriovorax sp. Seq25_V TaxID=1201288 RepID=UPI00038A1473|nr:flagellar FliJ family protein [Bacteriovorax sp. Seq25_V]EQC44774.1 flagellar FliJ protein [Bacteriovorax sp. Seq25_V]
MAQKFKFKLDGLLKVREFKEKRIKLELGEILKEIEEAKATIAKAQQDIEECYEAQEAFVSEPAAGRMVQFFPQYIQSRRDEQKIQENILYSLNRKYQEKIKELAQAKGEVKVIDNLKDKQQLEFNKKREKKFQENIDELTIIKKHRENKV